MKVPEKLINFRVYEDGDDLVGVADVTLPTLDAMTETVKGAGIAGEVESPVMGHYSYDTGAELAHSRKTKCAAFFSERGSPGSPGSAAGMGQRRRRLHRPPGEGCCLRCPEVRRAGQAGYGYHQRHEEHHRSELFKGHDRRGKCTGAG